MDEVVEFSAEFMMLCEHLKKKLFKIYFINIIINNQKNYFIYLMD